MSPALEALTSRLQALFAGRLRALLVDRGEVSITVAAQDLLPVAGVLRDDPPLGFDTLIDLCGVDYLQYGNAPWEGLRFCSVVHLLSVRNNHRLRLKTFAGDDEFPVIASLTGVWPAAGWFEREAFDMYGIQFSDHPDLRRILTDYGFTGYPLRKDFPLTGFSEVRYDEAQKRVVYEPVRLVQDFRKFDFMSPWEGAKYVLPGDEKASKP